MSLLNASARNLINPFCVAQVSHQFELSGVAGAICPNNNAFKGPGNPLRPAARVGVDINQRLRGSGIGSCCFLEKRNHLVRVYILIRERLSLQPRVQHGYSLGYEGIKQRLTHLVGRLIGLGGDTHSGWRRRQRANWVAAPFASVRTVLQALPRTL